MTFFIWWLIGFIFAPVIWLYSLWLHSSGKQFYFQFQRPFILKRYHVFVVWPLLGLLGLATMIVSIIMLSEMGIWIIKQKFKQNINQMESWFDQPFFKKYRSEQ